MSSIFHGKLTAIDIRGTHQYEDETESCSNVELKFSARVPTETAEKIIKQILNEGCAAKAEVSGSDISIELVTLNKG